MLVDQVENENGQSVHRFHRLSCLSWHGETESAKLRALRAFAPYVSSRLICLRALRAFASYVPSRLACLGHPTCAPYLSAYRILFT